jgi:hypothetical protein
MAEIAEKADSRSLTLGVLNRSAALSATESKEGHPISSSSIGVAGSDEEEEEEEEPLLARDGHEHEDVEAPEVAPREEEAVVAGWSNAEQAVARAERSIQVPKSPSVEASSKVKPEGGDATSVVVAAGAMGRESTQLLASSSR